MNLLELSMAEFRQFIQLVLWISLPLIVICLTVTTFLHYRRRKKGKLKAPDTVLYDRPDADMIQPTVSNNIKVSGTEAVLKQYEQQLLKGKEKYQTLEKSFRVLQENYSAVISRLNEEGGTDKDELQCSREKIQGYELKITQLEQTLAYTKEHGADDKTGKTSVTEEGDVVTAEMEYSVTKLTQEVSALRIENNHLKDKSNIINGDDPLPSLYEKLNKAEAENLILKNILPDLKSLEDMVGEKNLQINFLQQQLDQRIKHHHQLEYEQNSMNDLNISLQNSLMKSRDQLNSLEQDMLIKQSELDQSTGKSEQLEKEIIDKQTEMSTMSGELHTIKTKYLELQTNLNERDRQISKMEEDLLIEKEKAQSFEIKWEHTSQVISRIYREISVSVDDQMMVSAAGQIVDSVKKETLTE